MNIDSAQPIPPARPERPGWPELIAATVTALVAYVAGGLITLNEGDTGPISAGHLAFIVSAAAPAIAFFAAYLVRIRRFEPFGFRRVPARWVLLGGAAGIACCLLSWPVSWVVDPLFPGSEAVQEGYRDATQAGAVSLMVTVILGGVLTPIGEELLFRGVLANFLLRWGPWIGIGLSSVVFAFAHGVNSVMPVAFVVGLAAGWMLWRSGSIWPSIAVHIVYNTAGLLYHGVAG